MFLKEIYFCFRIHIPKITDNRIYVCWLYASVVDAVAVAVAVTADPYMLLLPLLLLLSLLILLLILSFLTFLFIWYFPLSNAAPDYTLGPFWFYFLKFLSLYHCQFHLNCSLIFNVAAAAAAAAAAVRVTAAVVTTAVVTAAAVIVYIYIYIYPKTRPAARLENRKGNGRGDAIHNIF